jgi:hypothetical protein
MNRVNVKSVCLTILCKMRILLGTDYTNPLDIGLHSVTKNRMAFIKMHIKCLHVDGMTLLRGVCAFALELEGGEMVMGKVEERF